MIYCRNSISWTLWQLKNLGWLRSLFRLLREFTHVNIKFNISTITRRKKKIVAGFLSSGGHVTLTSWKDLNLSTQWFFLPCCPATWTITLREELFRKYLIFYFNVFRTRNFFYTKFLSWFHQKLNTQNLMDVRFKKEKWKKLILIKNWKNGSEMLVGSRFLNN